MPLRTLAHKLDGLRVIASLGLVRIVICAVILGAPGPAWSDLFVQAGASSTTGGVDNCSSFTTGVCNVSVPGSASVSVTASYGGVGGTATASADPGNRASGNAQVRFSDVLFFVNGSATPTHLVVDIATIGAFVSGAGVSGDFAEVQLFMSLQDLSNSSNKASATYVLDIEGGHFTSSGLPLNELSLDLPDGHAAELSLQLFLDTRASEGDNASASAPTSVFVSASNPYTSASGTVYPVSPVPEPGSLLLVGSGLAGLGAWGRKRLRRI